MMTATGIAMQQDASPETGTKALFHAAVLLLCAGLASCVTNIEDRPPPLYPGDWPALDTERTCPDLSGIYRAVSEEAAPLTYPPGGQPHRRGLFGDRKSLLPTPKLGRRILPWHLAGCFSEMDPVWNDLDRYAARLSDAGWVRLSQHPGGVIEVSAGMHGQSLLKFRLTKEAHSGTSYPASLTYECRDGGLVVTGGFPEPVVENPSGGIAHATFTFFTAADGSLVMLEEQYHGRSTRQFKKWWRWRRMQ